MMKATELCRGLAIVVAVALVAVFAATPVSAAPAPKIITNTSLCTIKSSQTGDPGGVAFNNSCNPSPARVDAWHFVYTYTGGTTATATNCKALLGNSLNVSLDCDANGSGETNVVAPFTSAQGGTCFYDLHGYSSCTLISATGSNGSICPSNLNSGGGPQFNLSSAPCVIKTTTAVADFNNNFNETGTLDCTPTDNLTNPAGANACIPIANETTSCAPFTPVTTQDLPDANIDIALTNAPQNTAIKFHVYSAAGDATSCHVDICNITNEIFPTNFEAVTGGLGTVVANTPNYALSPVWTITGIADGKNLKAFKACVVDTAGTESTACGGCEEWPIQGTPGGGCTRTRGFWGNHVPCGKDLALPVGFPVDQYTQVERDAVCAQLGLSDAGDACNTDLCADLAANGGGCDQLGAQLVAALLNQAVFGTAIPAECNLAAAITAFQSGDDATCSANSNALEQCLDTFNNSGEDVTFGQCVRPSS
jgi:hypothetical protein